MSLAYIGLGSNLGDGLRNILEAWQKAGSNPKITTLAISSPYASRPVNKRSYEVAGEKLGKQWFTNAVGVVETRLTPFELLALLLGIEETMGRDRSETVDRPLDLDIVYFDDLVSTEEELTLPHPEMQRRAFVLVPLAEIAPDRPHPVTGMTTREMIRLLPFGFENDLRKLTWKDQA